jgi:hypothetical protein
MRPGSGLDQRMLLDLADVGRQLGPVGREVALIEAFCSDLRDAADLDVGTTQARLLDLCEARIGPELIATMRCTACGAGLDVRIDTDAVRQPASPGAEAILSVEMDGVVARFRLPRPADLLAVERIADAESARDALLERCLVGLDGAERPDAPLLAAIAAAMGEAMPQADVELVGRCERCDEPWSAGLDAGLFLWSDVEARANRLADDVHALATAYHWSEGEILALSPARRRRYLERIAG